MNQSQFLAINCNSHEAREISRVHGTIGFGFASRWLKNWRESFKPITMRSNCNHVITFDSHLKTALSAVVVISFVLTAFRLNAVPTLYSTTCSFARSKQRIRLVTAVCDSIPKSSGGILSPAILYFFWFSTTQI